MPAENRAGTVWRAAAKLRTCNEVRTATISSQIGDHIIVVCGV
jgi:hypothetical protein